LVYSKTVVMTYLKAAEISIIPEYIPIYEQGIRDVLKDDGSVEVEFRTVTGSGNIRWLQVRGNLYARQGSKYIIVTVIQDITEKKSIEEELQLQAERLHILLEAEGEKIVAYNAKTDVVVIRDSGDHLAVGEIIMNSYRQQFDVSNIHEEDVERYRDVFDGLLKSPKHDTIEIRTKRFDGDYTWYQLNLTSLLGAEGYVTRIVGRMININNKKLQEINLQLQAEKDALTGLYSKEVARQLIQNALFEESDEDVLNALMIIDLDDFMKVIELLGYSQGDKILEETGLYLSKVFKGSDIIGKDEDDRFIVYIRNFNKFSELDQLCSDIVKNVDYKLFHEKGEIHVTCSIGVAVYPYHGTNFDELMDKVNRALTRAKANGKCMYRIYDAAVTMAYHAMRKSEDTPYNPEKGMKLNRSTEELIMLVLLEDKVLEAALKASIELITVRYKFHRAYICGNEKGSLPLSNEVQFYVHGCEMGHESEEHYALRRVFFEVLYESYKNCSIIHEYDLGAEEMRLFFQAEGIKSLLYYPITSKGEYQGAIVFENREDVQLEFENSVMEELRSLFRIIEAHILQIGLMDRLGDFATQIEMLDNLDSFVYIINTDTHELSFINKKILMQSPDVKIGDICYKAIQHRDTPCEQCIFSNMNKNDSHDRHTEEMFNYSLRCWCRCSASWLECKEENTLGMLNCIDISEYFIG
ncbi:MAG: diguanylate cyclase, partial [Lachnospiraceae bacterium]|nr:diguanylate cyclase [Lachnospiraceae bacterium]